MTAKQARLFVVMGVSGCGKSTIGDLLAQHLSCPFLDGDGYHPTANKEKMRNGIALTDEDRWPWLSILTHAMHDAAEKSGCAVAACSALKHSYRDFITSEAGERVTFIHLAGSKELILGRMRVREHEYMPTSLLDSQFATLEPPTPDEDAVSIDISQPTDAMIGQIVSAIGPAGHADS